MSYPTPPKGPTCAPHLLLERPTSPAWLPTIALAIALTGTGCGADGQGSESSSLDGGETQADSLDTSSSTEESEASGVEDEDSGNTDDTASGGTCSGGKVVNFVYFVEADEPFMESQRQDIEDQAFVFQQYWFEQLGVTFYLSDPVVEVVMADHESDWYINTPDGIHDDERWYRLGNIKNEVYPKLGIQDFDPNHRVMNYPTARADGRVGGNFGGAWMDGDDLTCISGATGTYPYDESNPAHCLGHAVHEFGHILGLDHQGPETDCMQLGFYNTFGGSGMCDFSTDNVAQVLADPINAGWFEAMPGETCAP